jgi:DNA-binding transcriptional regulator GbsR (MarR family)
MGNNFSEEIHIIPVSSEKDLPINDISELFAHSSLGRSGGMVYTHLTDDPKSVTELAELTGKNRKTVSNALERLQRYNLAQSVKSGRWDKWIRGNADLSQVAELFDCEEKAEKRKQRIEDQRNRFRQRMIDTDGAILREKPEQGDF